MPTDDETPTDAGRCHCGHVAVLRTKVRHLMQALGLFAALTVAILGKVVGEMIWSRLQAAPPPIVSGERMGSDRIEHNDGGR